MAEGSDEFSDVPNLSAQTPTRRESRSRKCKRKSIFDAEENDEDLLAFLLDSEEETAPKKPRQRQSLTKRKRNRQTIQA